MTVNSGNALKHARFPFCLAASVLAVGVLLSGISSYNFFQFGSLLVFFRDSEFTYGFATVPGTIALAVAAVTIYWRPAVGFIVGLIGALLGFAANMYLSRHLVRMELGYLYYGLTAGACMLGMRIAKYATDPLLLHPK